MNQMIEALISISVFVAASASAMAYYFAAARRADKQAALRYEALYHLMLQEHADFVASTLKQDLKRYDDR